MIKADEKSFCFYQFIMRNFYKFHSSPGSKGLLPLACQYDKQCRRGQGPPGYPTSMNLLIEKSFHSSSIFTIFSLIILLFLVLTSPIAYSMERERIMQEKTIITSQKSFEQIEVGGPFAGVEFHRDAMLPARISFFYPVANSIDVSGDYWNRHLSRVLMLGIKAGDNPMKRSGDEMTEYRLTPYSVEFQKIDDEKLLQISYRFCKNKPAMVVTYRITNKMKTEEKFQVLTLMDSTLRTSSTYNLKDRAWTKYNDKNSAVMVNFDSPETGNACLFTLNAGEKPGSFTTVDSDALLNSFKMGESVEGKPELPRLLIDRTKPEKPVTAFLYKKLLKPGETMTIIQIIGTCKQAESGEVMDYLMTNFSRETELYQEYILKKALEEGVMKTGDSAFDETTIQAKAILAANAHYLDGDIVPMPCPAEYNFFFTHDILLTDLAAVYFDCERVKRDLKNIAQRTGSNGIIPHAYYWKDDHYEVEYAGSDNWNHLWFVMVSARYLRHSGDREMVEKLYPLIETSLKTILKNEKDSLIWAYRPDWWDIGTKFGPRAYMTILTIGAMREFGYISTVLNKDCKEAFLYETLSDKMQAKMNHKLWDEEQKYLINFFEDGSKDAHYYTGSLLSAHFNLMDDHRKNELVKTASEKLVDEKLGAYNAFPMDFHQLKDFFKFAGDEAGEPYFYMNGGIWSHGTAWFALALMSVDRKAFALKFMRDTMTIDGVMRSPNGQPAMFEYRVGKPDDEKVYGRIDKPRFLWAAGWYLYCWYNLFGAEETPWNLVFTPYMPKNGRDIFYNMLCGGKNLSVRVSGSGKYIKTLKYNGASYPSAVIPENPPGDKVEITMGKPEMPIIYQAGFILTSCEWKESEKEMKMELKAFPGHEGRVCIYSPIKAKRAVVDDRETRFTQEERDGGYWIEVEVEHRNVVGKLWVGFE